MPEDEWLLAHAVAVAQVDYDLSEAKDPDTRAFLFAQRRKAEAAYAKYRTEKVYA